MNAKGRTLIKKVRPLYFFIFLLLFTPTTFASESHSYIEKALKLNLANDPFWKNLLHFSRGQSQILDQDFFLSERGRFDAEAELEATLQAYFASDHIIKREDGDKNVVCLFPARYAWLNEKLNLPNYRCDAQTCPNLTDWARLNEIESVGIMYVSGYLGNPASSFGHVLLNLKIKGSEEMWNLLDRSITYGATVPLNENMLMYVFKGLLGGYFASFTDKYFYAHDQVYSNREARDMWEYTLNLSDSQKKLLIFHIAEVLTKRNRYYFLSANCAQRMAALLDIFIDEDVYNFPFPIYVPEELFARLHQIDAAREKKGMQTLVKSIKYIPSARRHLYYETARLTSEERAVYREITKNQNTDFAPSLQKLPVEGRIHVLNSLLAYQYYKLLAQDEESPDQKLKEYKDKILLERLNMPSRKEEPVVIPTIASPKNVSPPSSFNVGYVHEKGSDAYPTLGMTVFRKESVGLNALEYNDLVGLSLNLGVNVNTGEVFVDTFDFLKIRDFRTYYIKEANESPLSWKVRAGIDRYNDHNDTAYDYVFDGGIGLVNKLGNLGIYYGFVNGGVHALDQHFRAGPSAGFVIGNDILKLQTDFGIEFGLQKGGYIETLETKLQYQLNRSNALQASYEKTNRERLSVSYIFYW